MPLQATVTVLTTWASAVAARTTKDERGSMVTETVILVAIFAALAIAVGAIIVTKVTQKANSIPMQ